MACHMAGNVVHKIIQIRYEIEICSVYGSAYTCLVLSCLVYSAPLLVVESSLVLYRAQMDILMAACSAVIKDTSCFPAAAAASSSASA